MLTVVYLNYLIIIFLIFTSLSYFFNLNFSWLYSSSSHHLINKIILYIFIINFVFFNYLIYTIYLYQFINLYNINLYKITNYNFYFSFIYIFILITVISIIYCLSYNFSELNSFLIYISIIYIAGFGLFFTNSILFFFIYYELLLIPSFFILYMFSKTRRSVEASYLMFFWTQFGAMFLIFIFLYIYTITNSSLFINIKYYNFSKFEINFIFLNFLIGFGVKLPIWPFYEWLPKAHVEASTNFSIFLSGVLVKFAFFGFFKCVMMLETELNFIYIYPYLLVGLCDSIFKMYYQLDIKKLIAYATVAEMHWLLICLISGQSILWLSGFCMLISHAILSTNSFLLVDSIARRFKTRLVNEVHAINYLCPKLFLLVLINCIVFLGFPGSLFFISEFLFFSFLLDLFPLLYTFLIILIYLLLASFFFKIWLNILFSSINISIKKIPLDLDKTELLIFSFLIILIFWLGFTWCAFIF